MVIEFYVMEYLFFDKYKKIKKLLDKEKNHVRRKYTRNFSQNLQIKVKRNLKSLKPSIMYLVNNILVFRQ